MTIETIALDQVGVVLLSVNELQNEHFNKCERCIDGRENSLDGILPSISILIGVVGVVAHGLENHSIAASADLSFNRKFTFKLLKLANYLRLLIGCACSSFCRFGCAGRPSCLSTHIILIIIVYVLLCRVFDPTLIFLFMSHSYAWNLPPFWSLTSVCFVR